MCNYDSKHPSQRLQSTSDIASAKDKLKSTKKAFSSLAMAEEIVSINTGQAWGVKSNCSGHSSNKMKNNINTIEDASRAALSIGSQGP